MRIRGGVKSPRLLVKNVSLETPPYWDYEDIGGFFLILVWLGLILRLLVRFQFLSQFDITNPSVGLQSAVIALLSAGLYFILRFRHRQPVLKPLGWVVPKVRYIVTAVIVGPSFAAGIALYLRLRNQVPPTIPIEFLILGLVFGPILEESLFRGCLLPLLVQTTGTLPAVIIVAVLFALFHRPASPVHWVSFTTTGVAYGWLRLASHSTTAPVARRLQPEPVPLDRTLILCDGSWSPGLASARLALKHLYYLNQLILYNLRVWVSVGGCSEAWKTASRNDATWSSVHIESKHRGMEARPIRPGVGRLAPYKFIGEIAVEFQYADFGHRSRREFSLCPYGLDQNSQA